MYVYPNFKTKRELKEALQRGERVTVYSPGIPVPRRNGIDWVEGPHYPKPHTWYAEVEIKDAMVVKVIR